jgi:hypothetical protein
MWGVVVGVAGLAYGLWLAWSRPPAPAAALTLQARSPLAARTPVVRHPGALDTPHLKQRAAYCGLQVNDWVDATRWAADHVNPGLELLDALRLAYGLAPGAAWATWPLPVRRVYCTYLGS